MNKMGFANRIFLFMFTLFFFNFLLSVSNIDAQESKSPFSIYWINHQYKFGLSTPSIDPKVIPWTFALPGEYYKPAKKFVPIPKSQISRKTPLDAAIAYFSANQTCDKEWILDSFPVEERSTIQPSLDNQEVFNRNCQYFVKSHHLIVSGEAQYKEYGLVFVSFNESGTVFDWVFIKNGDQWLFTNQLGADSDIQKVFSALSYMKGEIDVKQEGI